MYGYQAPSVGTISGTHVPKGGYHHQAYFETLLKQSYFFNYATGSPVAYRGCLCKGQLNHGQSTALPRWLTGSCPVQPLNRTQLDHGQSTALPRLTKGQISSLTAAAYVRASSIWANPVPYHGC
jgi:hypothetical protein